MRHWYVACPVAPNEAAQLCTLLTCPACEMFVVSQLAGKACSTKDVDISVKLIAPPLYVMLTSSPSKEVGLAAVQNAIDATRKVIEEKGGKLTVKVAPRVTTQREETDLSRQLAGVEEGDEEDSD